MGVGDKVRVGAQIIVDVPDVLGGASLAISFLVDQHVHKDCPGALLQGIDDGRIPEIYRLPVNKLYPVVNEKRQLDLVVAATLAFPDNDRRIFTAVSIEIAVNITASIIERSMEMAVPDNPLSIAAVEEARSMSKR